MMDVRLRREDFGGNNTEMTELLEENKDEQASSDVTSVDVEDKTVFRRRVIATVCIFASYVANGFLGAQRGPSLLDLELITNTDTGLASTFFTSGAVGALIGTLVAGFLFDKFQRGRLQLGVAVFIAGILQAVTGLVPSYAGMMVIFLLSGFAGGVINASANAEVMRLWRHRAGPFMEALHFSYAAGSQFSPLVTAPFLAPRSEDANSTDVIATTTSTTLQVTSTLTSYLTGFPVDVAMGSVEAGKEKTRVVYAFLIGTALCTLVSLPLIMPCLTLAVQPVQPLKFQSSSEPDKVEKKRRPRAHYVLAFSLIAAFFFTYASLEICFENFLLAFVVEGQKWKKDVAAYLTTVFWASFAVMRFAGIFFIRYVSPTKVMMACCSCLVLSLAAFTLSSSLHVMEAIWTCIATTGLSMSVQFPTTLLLIEKHFFKVTGKVTTLVFLSAMVGAIAIPPLYGELMTHIGEMWYCYLFDIEVAVLAALLISIIALSKTIFAK